MNHYSNADELTHLTLDKKTDDTNQHTPFLLQPIPRRLNRNGLNLGKHMPFKGFDIWTLYELFWLNTKRLPQVVIGEVFIPVTSPHLIEYKSFKLYLNRYNQTKISHWDEIKQRLTQNLLTCVKAPMHNYRMARQ